MITDIQTIRITDRESEPLILNSSDPVNLVLGKNAACTIINFQHQKATKRQLRFHLKENASLTIWNIVLGDDLQECVLDVLFEEPGATCENRTILFGRNQAHFDMRMTHEHQTTGGTSRIRMDGILRDAAFGRYDGMIRILQPAAQTDATLHEKTLLLSDTAKAEAVPRLEIGTNDVKAAHSASMTRIDEEQLFYAAARGIPEAEATRMIAEGFMENAFRDLPSEEILKQCRTFIRASL